VFAVADDVSTEPGVHWSRPQLSAASSREKAPPIEWDLFSAPEVTPLSKEDLDAFVRVLRSDDKTVELLRRGMDLRKFKNVHYSTQLALTTIEARESLSERKVTIPRDVSVRQRREMAELQSPARLFDVLARETRSSTSLLRKNASLVEKHSGVRKLLGEMRPSDHFDPTGVDTEIGQRLKWAGQSLHTAMKPTKTPARYLDRETESFSYFEGLTGAEVRGELAELLEGTPFDPGSPCFCEFVNRTWKDRISRNWSYDLPLTYPCDVEWCWSWGVPYPCGVEYCTSMIRFNFSFNAEVVFSATFDCLGLRISAQGSACVSATVLGETLEACIEVFATAGAGIDIEITSGPQQGQCMYGGELTLGLRVRVAGSVLWQGSIGYDFALELPCIGLLGDDCLKDTLIFQSSLRAALKG
jgi:hypothetical protein